MSEEEFLKNYNPNDFDLLSVTTDILIFSVSDIPQDNYRKLGEKELSVLLVKRSEHPFKGKWCLPGGFVGINEDLDEAPKRILKKETNLDSPYLEQLYTFGTIDRDPRMRIISVAYMSLVDKLKLNTNLVMNASWFKLNVLEDKNDILVTLDNDNEKISFKVKKILKEKTANTYDYKIYDNSGLAFDHALVIINGLNRLRNKIEYTDIVFNMMPKYFTLGELQQVYEVILGKKLLDPAFRRIIAKKVVKTDMVKSGEGHRPSSLFKYNNQEENYDKR